MIITMDAMHTQSKTLKKIVANGNDYVVQVKDNQSTLLDQIKFNTKVSEYTDTNKTIEHNRGRFEIREIFVYDDLYGIDTNKWLYIKEIVKVVKRKTYKKDEHKSLIEISFYISSKIMSLKIIIMALEHIGL